MALKFNLIAAACQNMGIGKNGNLPWRIKSEMAHFTEITSQTGDENKKNVVLMGRKTWDSIPAKFKPLSNRINFILSRSDVDVSEYTNVYAFKSLQEVVSKLQDQDAQELYENVWVIGGSYIYKLCMDSEYFYRLYLTKIHKDYDCDTFFPKLGENLKEIVDPRIPTEVQTDKEIKFEYHVYENTNFSNE